MKAALLVLLLAVVPSHVRIVVFGVPVSVPGGWLIVAAEVITSAGVIWLAFRATRRFRSTPWMRPVAGAW
jgi:hypothetical protein